MAKKPPMKKHPRRRYQDGGKVKSDENLPEFLRGKSDSMPVQKSRTKTPDMKATPSQENLPEFLRGKKAR